jgi:hypothetical protein
LLVSRRRRCRRIATGAVAAGAIAGAAQAAGVFEVLSSPARDLTRQRNLTSFKQASYQS